MENFIGLLLRTLESAGIFLGKEQVQFDELKEKPKLILAGNLLKIETKHSLRNSAKEIYKFELKFKEKKFLIKAFQKLVSPPFNSSYRQEFLISEQLQQSNPANLEFYWVDPDDTLHALPINETSH
ncbi:hypothetical protein Lepto7376_3419 [[Leptolyngbya] sp. PCC 7376]|uniref:hypothetical protein n=1 Tax=[Leptolyngbya] sp. PCC 7376 TaxID=111781 RepID=UPI00029EEFED|nr:hypothetical protein [[Leptolyngbya] sp. PCC 7376]AFY39624.1 hypothetical protein Lepto7376_3419 [[Leptolyngbya] sp. PCC 7376]